MTTHPSRQTDSSKKKTTENFANKTTGNKSVKFRIPDNEYDDDKEINGSTESFAIEVKAEKKTKHKKMTCLLSEL